MKPARALFTLLVLLIGCYAPVGVDSAPIAQEGYILTADGVRIFYKVVGSGPETLVAVHGGPGNTMESILADMEPLAKGRTVIYYDQRGNGRSDLMTDGSRLAIARHVEDLETLRRHFRLEKLTLLGNSWGGLLVGFYAAAHPDRVERLVLHDPAPPARAFISAFQERVSQRVAPGDRDRLRRVSEPRAWTEASDPRAVCREFYSLLLPGYFADRHSFSRMRGDVCAGSDAAVRNQQLVNHFIWLSLGAWDLRKALGEVKAPTLVVHGAQDPIPLESSSAWAAAFPNARLLIIPDAGHVPQVEQPKSFFSALEIFLKGGWPFEAKQVRDSAANN